MPVSLVIAGNISSNFPKLIWDPRTTKKGNTKCPSNFYARIQSLNRVIKAGWYNVNLEVSVEVQYCCSGIFVQDIILFASW